MSILALCVSWEPAVHPKLLVAVDHPTAGRQRRRLGGPLPAPCPDPSKARDPTRPATVLPPTRAHRELSFSHP